MSQAKSKVAVIGLGTIGTTVATNLVKGNRAVIVSDRKLEKAKGLAAELGALARPEEIPAAIKEADIIVLALWFDTIREFIQTRRADLQGKIIIDPSNPIGPDGKGGFTKTIPPQESAGMEISALLPGEARLAKALGTLSATSLSAAAFRKSGRAVLFYATDDNRIDTTIEELIRDSGFEPLRAGAIDQSIRIEAFGDLHELGGLGRTVSLAEAKEKLKA